MLLFLSSCKPTITTEDHQRFLDAVSLLKSDWDVFFGPNQTLSEVSGVGLRNKVVLNITVFSKEGKVPDEIEKEIAKYVSKNLNFEGIKCEVTIETDQP